MERGIYNRWIGLLGIFLFSLSLQGANSDKAIPPELKPWVPWVNKHLDFLSCPVTEGGQTLNEQDRLCAWPGTLQLEISQTRGQFEQNWKVYRDSWVPLPGDNLTWPLVVSVNGQNAMIQNRNQKPYVWLKRGTAKIIGYWKWQQQPQRMFIPPLVANLELTLNGNKIHFPAISNNQLHFAERNEAQTQADELDIRVYRLLNDDHPMRLITQLHMEVSGRVREVNLGKALPVGFNPIVVDGELPAFYNAASELIVQLRPGSWTMQLSSFAPASLNEFRFTRTTELWPAQEIWSFNDKPEIRVATIEGIEVIDPESSQVPHHWRNFPSFLFESGQTASLNQKFRGISQGTSNRLSLNRQLWLDFAGDRWRFEDQVSGTLREQWRLSMSTPYQLQYADESDQALLITSLKEGQTGVEVRLPAASIVGGGEIAPNTNLPIAGWQQSFESVNWTLNLPPAHRLLFASGAERSDSWFEQWNLWNVFWVMLLTTIAYRFGNFLFAGTTLVTLVLIFHEPQSPVASLSNLVLAFALYQVLPAQHKIMQWIRVGYLGLSFLIVIVSAGLFMINQVRVLIHPQLEHYSPQPYQTKYRSSQDEAAETAMVLSSPQKMKDELSEKIVVTGSRIKRADVMQRYNNDMVIQTGHGKPAWQWNQYQLYWSSPVTAEQEVSLWMASPWIMTLWRLLTIGGILIALGFVLRSVSGKRLHLDQFKQWLGSTAAIGLICLLPLDTYADIPDKETLKELQQWLHQAPECAPDCVAISGLRLVSESRQGQEYLILEAQVDALADTAFAIPFSEHWSIRNIKVDGRLHNWIATHKGRDWLYVEAGRHRIQFTGLLSGTTSFNLKFPERPFNVQNLTDIWELEGIRNGSLLGDEISFTKKAQAIALSSDDKLAGVQSQAQQALAIAPMVKVIRQVWLDSEWRMRTWVHRIAPERGDLHVSVPQLSFERVISANYLPDDAAIKVHIPSGVQEIFWDSIIDRKEQLEFIAANSAHYVEEWRFHISHQWRTEFSGVPSVWPESFAEDDHWTFRYLPWAGEQLAVSVQSPTPVKGFSQSFDQVNLRVTAGDQQRRVELEAKYRSSRGGQSHIEVGEGHHLNALIDGRKTHLQIQDEKINYTVAPGEHNLSFDWKESLALGFRSQLPQVNLNAPISNVAIQWQVPENRWVLWTSGPVIGPAIIYWGELLAFLLLAAIVWRSQLLPIKPYHWLLLGLGLSTQSWWLLVFITLWFIVLSVHQKYAEKQSDTLFNVVQIMLAIFSVFVLLSLIASIPMSLMSRPDMGIVGNQSNGYILKWYLDAAINTTPEVVIYSLPMWVYKLAMLSWALWLAFALVSWARWGWQTLNDKGFWRQSGSIIPSSKPSAESSKAPE